MHDSPEELHKYIMKQVQDLEGDKEAIVSLSKTRMVYSFLAEIFFFDDNHSFLTELFQAMAKLYNGTERSKFDKTAKVLLSLSTHLILNPQKPFISIISYKSEYDIPKWIRDGYEKPLWEYYLSDPQLFDLISRNESTVRSAMERDKNQNRTDGYNFFRYMNSSLMRRIIVPHDSEVSSRPFVEHPQEVLVVAQR